MKKLKKKKRSKFILSALTKDQSPKQVKHNQILDVDEKF